MTTHLLNVSLRTAGRLAARGVLSTSEAATFAQAVACDYWCDCGEHRTDRPGGLCPSCLDDERRAG